MSAPTLDTPAPMRLHAGEVSDQTLHASDVDGDPLTFLLNRGPSYMTVMTTDPGTGSATGNIHVAPSLNDPGMASAVIAVYDGNFYVIAPLDIAVYPIIDRPTDMTVSENSTADQTLTGSDSDGLTLTFTLVSGPSFATVSTTGDRTGNIHLSPGMFDSGYHDATVSITDGVASHSVSFLITVNNFSLPPVLAQPADMHGIPYTITEQALTASDPDLQTLTFSKVSGPAYMSVGPVGLPVPPRGYVRLNPTPGDTGTAVATVRVSDGTSFDEKSFTIRVDTDNHPPALHPRELDLAEGTDLDRTIAASDPDGQRLFVTVSNVPRFMTVGAQSQPVGSDSLLIPIRLLPGYEDAGTYRPRFRISDGWDQVTDTLAITVRPAYPGETSLRLVRRLSLGGVVDYEYSAVDGTYSMSSGPTEIRLDFQATSGSGARWTFRFAGPLVEGEYEYPPELVAFIVIGSDSTVPGLVSCTARIDRLQIKRIRRRLDGSIGSFWATFQQTCGGSVPFSGEIRYQVQDIAITLVAPRWLTTNTNERVLFQISAVDTARDAISLSVSDLPAGAAFLDMGGGQGAFGWTPAREQVGDYLMRTIAISAGGLADTAFTTIHVFSLNRPPYARSNGPYFGTAGMPVLFTSSGSGDADGDALSYHWTFGDGGSAEGASPSHIYGAAGPYPVALIVSDGLLAGGDQTLARISWPDSARVFEVGSTTMRGPGPLRLQAGSGRFCVAMEIADGPPSGIVEIDRFSIRMGARGSGGTDAILADPTALALGDADRNGIPDVTVCFSREALRRLFDDVSGRLSVLATVEFSLMNGRGFRASFPMDVVGPDGRLTVLTAPNPFHPAGVFSFVTSRVGPARLMLFDSRGRLVRTVLDTGSLPTGYHDIPVDGRGENGTGLTSGVYFYRLETPEGTRTGRMAIVK